MHEKELRLALVCYGGVSLAIYMSGVTKEVLKLVRASKALHSVVDPFARRNLTYDSAVANKADETDTERLYLELLQAHGPELELRVVVDILSGASAGGINAVFLARALAHDLSLDPHRTMWLQHADVTELMEPETMADQWSKFYLYPFFWLMNWRRLKRMIPNDETRRKLSIFVRSRWFRPPFSGNRMLTWMMEACAAMGKSYEPSEDENADGFSSSLMPPGSRLDLFVSLTNYHGRYQTIRLHDPKEIQEREHRTGVNFTAHRRTEGIGASDFEDENIPGLAFAARATSSFPGAFPAAQIGDIETAAEALDLAWPDKDRFLQRNFPGLLNGSQDPDKTYFIDGSVVNNKPFAAAINALGDRPAQREVDRRIVYIDPVPEDLSVTRKAENPGFFRAILASLSDIPRNEPINDELQWVNDYNRRSRRLRAIIASVKTEVDDLIDTLIKKDGGKAPSVALVATWRDRINAMAKDRAGYSYTGYAHAKTYVLLDTLSILIHELCEASGATIPRDQLLDLLNQWAHNRKILLETQEDDIIAHDVRVQVDELARIEFLRDFDVNFRIRRLRFVVSNLNEIYQSTAARKSELFDPLQLSGLKRQIYLFIDQLKDRWRAASYVENARGEIARFAASLDRGGVPEEETEGPLDRLGELLNRLAQLMEMQDRDFVFDSTIAEEIAKIADPRIRQELFRSYIGFPFFDVLTLPLLQTSDLTELEPIRVDRISPEDCNGIRTGGAQEILKGIGFARFGAFFSRSDRENDYLWGRLNSAERMVDFIISAGTNKEGHSSLRPDFDLADFKKRLFLSILEAEEPHLGQSRILLRNLRTEIEAL